MTILGQEDNGSEWWRPWCKVLRATYIPVENITDQSEENVLYWMGCIKITGSQVWVCKKYILINKNKYEPYQC